MFFFLYFLFCIYKGLRENLILFLLLSSRLSHNYGSLALQNGTGTSYCRLENEFFLEKKLFLPTA